MTKHDYFRGAGQIEWEINFEKEYKVYMGLYLAETTVKEISLGSLSLISAVSPLIARREIKMRSIIAW